MANFSTDMIRFLEANFDFYISTLHDYIVETEEGFVVLKQEDEGLEVVNILETYEEALHYAETFDL